MRNGVAAATHATCKPAHIHPHNRPITRSGRRPYRRRWRPVQKAAAPEFGGGLWMRRSSLRRLHGPRCDNLTIPRGRRRRCSAGTPKGCSRKSACTRAGAPFQALRLPSARLAEPAVMSRAASSLAVIGSPCRPLEPRPRPPWSRVGRAKRRGIAYRALCGRGDLCPDVRRLPRPRAAADAGLISGSSADGPCRGRGGAGCGRLTCWSSMRLSTAPVRRSSHRSGAGDQRLHQGSADSGHGHVRAARSHQTTTIDDGAARRTNQHPALDRSPAFTRVAEVKAATRKRDGGGEAIRGA